MDLPLVLMVIYFSAVGSCLGTLSGVFPGMHINTLALLLTALYPSIESFLAPCLLSLGFDEGILPLLISSMIMSAAVVHSFVDFVPSIFLGAPDEESVMSMLPGHRLLLSGRGMEAVYCAAQGSLCGCLLSILVCIPLSYLLGPPLRLLDCLDALIPAVIVVSMVVLILHEKGRQVRAEIDVRRGKVSLSKPYISIKRQVPVDGQEVELSGRLEKRLFFLSLRTATSLYLIKGVKLRSPSFVTVKGVWRIRRRAGRSRMLALALMSASGSLGFIVMNSTLPLSKVWMGLNESVLFPLLTGLFGIPALVLASKSRSIPQQKLDVERQPDILSAAKGVISGGVVGWFPGITSTTGTVIGSMVRRKRGDASKQFITMVSSVGTSATVFSLLALALAGKGRSGAMLAVKDVLEERAIDLSFPSDGFSLLLLSVLVSSSLGYILTMKIGLLFARRFSGADLSGLNKLIIVLLIALVLVFTGLPGLIVLAIATTVGMIPPKVGISRVHLTGCLLVPLLLYFLGLETILHPLR